MCCGVALNLRFESCVVLDGNQAAARCIFQLVLFESCVVLDGNQAIAPHGKRTAQFESCVVLDGNQAIGVGSCCV